MGGKLAAAFDSFMEPTWKPKMSPALSAGLTVLLESKGEKVDASLSWGVCRGQEAERNPKGNGTVAAENLGFPNPWHLHGPTSLR